MVVTLNTDTLISDTIVEVIKKLNRQKKRADINSIYTKVIKVKKFENIAKADLEEKMTMLIVEKIICNKFTNNRDSFHINKDKVSSFDPLPLPFENENVSIPIFDHQDNLNITKSHKYSLSPLMDLKTPVKSNETQNISLSSSILCQESNYDKSPDFSITVKTPENSQNLMKIPNIDLTKGDIADSETLIDEMFEKIKFENLKKELIGEINQSLGIRFQNELVAFKDKCEKIVQLSYLNSKIYIQKLEEEISHKNQTINELLICLQNNSTVSPKITVNTTHDTSSTQFNLSRNGVNEILDELNKSAIGICNGEVDNNSSTTIKDIHDESKVKSNDSTHSKNISLENQLSLIRKKEHMKYQLEQAEKISEDTLPLQNSLDNNSSSCHETTPSVSHKWPKKTVLVVGDSMLIGVDEKRMSHRNNVKVRNFPGATIDDMFDYIKPLIQKCPDTVILHIGTNNCPNETSRAILDKLLNLKGFILKLLPSSKVIISGIINRTDNSKASLTAKHLNNHLRSLNLELIDNENIGEEYLGRKGLHLNDQGHGKFAMNLIRKIKTLKKD